MYYKSVVIIIIITFFLLSACGNGIPSGTKTTAIVVLGNDSITEMQLSCRMRILELDSVEDAGSAALFQLTKTLAMQEIARTLGLPLEDKFLNMEMARIDSGTLMPDKIAEIKAICGGNLMLYKQVFIRESMMPRLLNLHFAWNAEIHRPQAEKANERFGQVLIDPASMDMDSTLCIYRLSALALQSVQSEKNDTPQESNVLIDLSREPAPLITEQMENSMTARQNLTVLQLNEALEPLRAGQVYPKVMELQTMYWIVQLIEKKDAEKLIKIVSIPKLNYSDWLQEKIAQIPITVYNRERWGVMLQRLPAAKELFKNITIQ